MNSPKLIRYFCACSFALGTLCLADVRPAWAGCGNPCEIVVDPPVVDPAQGGCLDVLTHDDACDCGINVSIVNVCNTDLVASDFTFRICEGAVEAQHNCMNVQPRRRGWIERKLDSTGTAEFMFTLQTERGEEHVTVRGDVKEFTQGTCVCSAPGGATGSASSAMLPAMPLLLGCALIRRFMRR